MPRRTTLALALAAVPALAACSGGDADADAPLGPVRYHPVPGCGALDHTPCDIREATCQQRMLEIAACVRGSEAGRLPPVALMSKAAYAAYLEEQLAAEGPRPDPDHLERGLALLQLAAPGALSPSATIERSVDWVGGFYRFETRDIVIVDAGEPMNAPIMNALLVHEMVHVLQHRDVDLVAYYEQPATDDASLAAAAVVEGEGRLHEARALASFVGIRPEEVDWVDYDRAAIDNANAWALEQPSPYLVSYAAVAYAYGARFVRAAWEADGLEGVRALFTDPPDSTLALFASAEAEPPPPPREPAPPSAAPGWAPQSELVLGTWGTFLLLSLGAGTDAAHPVASAWRGDRLFVYGGDDSSGGEPETAVVWKVELSDAASAAAAATIVSELLPDANVEQTAAALVVAAASGGATFDDWTL